MRLNRSDEISGGERPRWRPWALVAPIVVLFLTMPLLRPLVGEPPQDSERRLMSTADSIALGRGLRLDDQWTGKPGTILVEGRTLSRDPPLFALALAGPAWVADRAGVGLNENPQAFWFWLTLAGVTLPTAVGVSLVYRMGRLFELSRPGRVALALLVSTTGGWVSFATSLNPHAPASAALMGSCCVILMAGASQRPRRTIYILILAGMLGALAGTVDAWTLPIVLPLPLVVLAMRWSWADRMLGVGMMSIGAAPLVWVHCAWCLASFGSVIPPAATDVLGAIAGVNATDSATQRLWQTLNTAIVVLVGQQGIFSHFPLSIVAIVGIIVVLRKHWPSHAKMLAAITLVGATTVVMLVATRRHAPAASFLVPHFLAFSPLLIFWLGAVLRRPLQWPARITFAGLAVFGAVVAIAGARSPVTQVDLPAVELASRKAVRN